VNTRAFLFTLSFILLIVVAIACQPQPNQVFIEVDGARQSLTTEGGTVRVALEQAGVELDKLDRVRPDLYTSWSLA
jgi:uncharacterized protein YabE (DUF348 family)